MFAAADRGIFQPVGRVDIADHCLPGMKVDAKLERR
jgi:hypothetical protein